MLKAMTLTARQNLLKNIKMFDKQYEIWYI